MIVYAQESYNIVGAAFEVYNKMGHGFLEAVYQECLELEFKKRGIPYEREKDIKIYEFHDYSCDSCNSCSKNNGIRC